MPNSRNFCTRALRLIGIAGEGDTPGGTAINDAHETLNDMIDAWAADGTTIYSVARQVFNLSALVQDYTLGTGGTLNYARPALPPSKASVISNSNPSQPHEIPIDVLDMRAWQRVSLKSSTSTLPRKVFIDNAFPMRNVRVWPIPLTADPDLVLYLPVALVEFADLDTIYTFPPAYRRAIRFNLARELAPEWEVAASDIPEVINLAERYLGDIRRINIAANDETVPIDEMFVRMGQSGYDIEIDE